MTRLGEAAGSWGGLMPPSVEVENLGPAPQEEGPAECWSAGCLPPLENIPPSSGIGEVPRSSSEPVPPSYPLPLNLEEIVTEHWSAVCSPSSGNVPSGSDIDEVPQSISELVPPFDPPPLNLEIAADLQRQPNQALIGGIDRVCFTAFQYTLTKLTYTYSRCLTSPPGKQRAHFRT